MKKASNILFLVGGILSFVWMAFEIIGGIIFAIFAGPDAKQVIIDGLNDGTITSSFEGTPEEVATLIQGMFIMFAVMMFIFAVFALVNGILALKAKKDPAKTNCIINIVFGFLSGVLVNTVGGILGLFCLPKPEDKPE